METNNSLFDKLEHLEMGFDDLIFQIRKGITHEDLETGRRRYKQFEAVRERKSKFGYLFNM